MVLVAGKLPQMRKALRRSWNNRNDPAAQRFSVRHTTSTSSVTPVTGTAAVDTDQDQTITITAQLANAADSITLESFRILLMQA